MVTQLPKGGAGRYERLRKKDCAFPNCNNAHIVTIGYNSFNCFKSYKVLIGGKLFDCFKDGSKFIYFNKNSITPKIVPDIYTIRDGGFIYYPDTTKVFAPIPNNGIITQGKVFMGTGFSKWCHEHRKKCYRKEINASKEKPKVEITNKEIIYNIENPEYVNFICELCNTSFLIKVYPGKGIYPKFCEDHRSEYRRLFYRKIHNILPIEPPKPSVNDINATETFDIEEEREFEESKEIVREIAASSESEESYVDQE